MSIEVMLLSVDKRWVCVSCEIDPSFESLFFFLSNFPLFLHTSGVLSNDIGLIHVVFY